MIAGHHSILKRTAEAMRCAVFASSYARANAGSWTTTNQGSLSMACWVWLADPPYPAVVGTVMSMHSSDGKYGAQLDPITSGGTRKFRIGFQYVTFCGPTATEVGGNKEWHHYALTYDKANRSAKGYLDGVELVSGSPDRWLASNKQLLATIACNGSGSSLMNCKVANANLYLRALSASEVASLASGISSVPTDADHQWLFENDAFADTGTATTKWNLTATGTVTFEDA